MLKTLGALALTTVFPKLFDKVGDVLVDLYDSVVGTPPKKPRKKRDTTKITHNQSLYVKWFHENNDGTAEQKTVLLNKHFGINKSKSVYSRIWNTDFGDEKYQPTEEIK